jgi:hypothetical protein
MAALLSRWFSVFQSQSKAKKMFQSTTAPAHEIGGVLVAIEVYRRHVDTQDGATAFARVGILTINAQAQNPPPKDSKS